MHEAFFMEWIIHVVRNNVIKMLHSDNHVLFSPFEIKNHIVLL